MSSNLYYNDLGREDGHDRRYVQGFWHDPSEYVHDAQLCDDDAAISKELLQKALSAVVQDTYNMISVDGDTSTNDTALGRWQTRRRMWTDDLILERALTRNTIFIIHRNTHSQKYSLG